MTVMQNSVSGQGSLRFHPQREAMFNELHTRPFPVIETPARISQLAILREADGLAEWRHIEMLCNRYSVHPPSPESSCYYQDFGGFEFRWERHTEFSTYTIIARGQDAGVFDKPAMSLIPAEWLQKLTGQIISALHVEVIPAPEQEPSLEEMRRAFEGHRLISSMLGDGTAQIWTAYRIHSDGAGRFLIHNRSLNQCQTGRLVRRLLELETYRMMILIAFPVAREIAPRVTEMDQQLARIIQQITDIENFDDERRLLGELSTLAASIEQSISDTNFRFSAAEAYHSLVLSRLDEIHEQEVRGLQTLREFLGRRLHPAYRTCEAVRDDLDDLSRRIDRASELLRTRVNLTIESQNQDLLQSMDRRGKVQLLLQQTVEGFSVAAISYYLMGLVTYMSETAESMGLLLNADVATGLAVPVVVGAVWWGIHRLKVRITSIS